MQAKWWRAESPTMVPRPLAKPLPTNGPSGKCPLAIDHCAVGVAILLHSYVLLAVTDIVMPVAALTRYRMLVTKYRWIG